MDFNDLYEEWVDAINQRPLTSSRFDDYNEVINLNQQIVNRMYSIRRYLEMNDETRINNTLTNEMISNIQNNISNISNNISNITNNLQNGMSNNIQNVSNNDILSTLFGVLFQDIDVNDMEDVKVTLDEDKFNKLFTETINESNKEKYVGKECNICMDEYKTDNIIIRLGCNHVFHKDCIKHWLCDERVTCPVCRKDTRDE